MEAMRTEEEGMIQKVRSRFGFEVTESVILKALSESNNDPDAAVTFLKDNPGFLARPLTVVRTATSTRGARVLAPVKREPLDDYEMADSIEDLNPKKKVKMEVDIGFEKQDSVKQDMVSDGSVCGVNPSSNGKMSFDDFLKATGVKVASADECLTSQVKHEPSPLNEEVELKPEPHGVKEEADTKIGSVKEEADVKVHSVKLETDVKVECMKREADVNDGTVKREGNDSDCVEIKVPNESKAQPIKVGPLPLFQKTSRVKKEIVEEKILNVEDGDFPEDPDWCLVGRKVVIALSTTRGRKLVDNEIVHFSFPPPTSKYNAQWIVRISTKRSGEVL